MHTADELMKGLAAVFLFERILYMTYGKGCAALVYFIKINIVIVHYKQKKRDLRIKFLGLNLAKNLEKN